MFGGVLTDRPKRFVGGQWLYAADRLVRIGPASVVAPTLKRVTLRVEDPTVRPALQCLLWTAYPGPE